MLFVVSSVPSLMGLCFGDHFKKLVFIYFESAYRCRLCDSFDVFFLFSLCRCTVQNIFTSWIVLNEENLPFLVAMKR